MFSTTPQGRLAPSRPAPHADCPGKWPLAWMVPVFERRPSGKTASDVDGGLFQVGTIHIGALNPGRSVVKDDFGKQNRPKMFTDTGLGGTTLLIFTESRTTYLDKIENGSR